MKTTSVPNAEPDDTKSLEVANKIKEARKLHAIMHDKYMRMYPEPKILPTAKLELMTPELVEELISRDTHNRKKKPQHVAYLSSEWKAGAYVITNNGIGVSVSGWIVDGGQRLESLRDAGYPPIYMWVVRNLPDDAQKVVDLGTKRSMSDILQLLLDTSVSAKVVAVLNVRLRARIDWMRGKWSPNVVLKEIESCMDGINKTAEVKGWSDVPAPIRAAVLDVYDATESEEVWKWLDQVIRGEHIGKGDPAYTFRQWHLTQKNSTGGNDMQIKRYYYATASLNAFVEKRKMSKFLLPVPEEELAAHIKALQHKPVRQKKAA